MIVETENGGLHSKWVPTSNSEGWEVRREFLRKSDVLNTPKGNGRVVLVSCSGRQKEKIELHNGYGLYQTSLRHIFDNFSMHKGFHLSTNIILNSEPKVGKTRSGDMTAVVMVNENLPEYKCLTIFTVLVDNLTPMLPNKYGLWGEQSDSYASSSQRECMHNKPKKWLKLTSLLRETDINAYDFEALTQNPESIPSEVLSFRNSFLGNICSTLPNSDEESPLMRGIYALSATSIIMSRDGFSGKSVVIRSKADSGVHINNEISMVQDNHLSAQAVGEYLGASPKQLYAAKLRKRIYDTTSPNFHERIGSFQMESTKISKDGGGSMSIGIYSESDGAKVGRDKDDFSSCGIWIEGDFLRYSW